MVHTYVSAFIVFVVVLTIQYYYCIVVIYNVRSSHIVSIRTGLKSTLIFEIDLPLSTPFQHVAAAYTYRMGRYLVLYTRVAVYQPITMRSRMIRVGALIYGL